MSGIQLSILKDGAPVKTFPLEGDALMGRAKDCAIYLDDPAISRHHALFQFMSGTLHVSRKSEFAPMMVNGVECAQSPLKEGDWVSLGPYRVQVIQMAPPSDSPPSEVTEGESEGVPSAEGVPQSSELGQEVNLENSLILSEEGQAAPPDFDIETPPLTNGAGLLGPAEGQSSASIEVIEEGAKTRVLSPKKITAKLIFKGGGANVETYDIQKDEVSIGRGKKCDIIITDKKSSRRNALIKREGARFVIQDLESVNGTYVNGVQIKEQELAGDDLIKIGGTEFEFKAISADYAAREKDLASVSPEQLNAEAPAFDADPQFAPPEVEQPGVDLNAVAGITGIDSKAGGKKLTLMERFKALPKRTQVIGAVAFLLLCWWLMEDDPTSGKKKVSPKKPVASSTANPIGTAAVAASFEALSAEQKKFVESQHSLAFDFYKTKDYDKALFEIEKIFTIVSDYKDSREIQRYAKEGKRRLEAIEEERRKKEEESKLKTRVSQLVEEAQGLMKKHFYEQAKELFSQILSLDPDNAQVSSWSKEIDAFEQQQKLEKQQKQVQAEINQQAWMVYHEGLKEKGKARYYPAIDAFTRTLDMGATDSKLLHLAKSMIASCHTAIKALLDPVLVEAKQLEDSQDYVKAFSTYQKATRIDPKNPGGFAGMNRIKGILHDRAKALYVEALLSESYSDFVTAQKMYKECIQVAPPDDVYHERATRKLGRYFKKSEDPQQ